MKKLFLLTGSLLLFSAIPSSAKEITYSDEYISFVYDDTAMGQISVSKAAERANYSFETRITYDDPSSEVSVTIASVKDYEEYFSEKYDDFMDGFINEEIPVEHSKEILNDGELPEIKFTLPNMTYYKKLIAYNDETFVAVYLKSQDEAADNFRSCKLFYDSIDVTEKYVKNGYVCTEDIFSEIIYSNVSYSPQALTYADETAWLLEGLTKSYLPEDDVRDRVESLAEQAKNNYLESTFCFDSNIYLCLSKACISLEYGEPEDVLENLVVLKSLLNDHCAEEN